MGFSYETKSIGVRLLFFRVRFVEGFVQRINPLRGPQVVGVLLDLDYKEDAIKKLIMSVKNMIPVAELVMEVDKRGRIKILQEFLESKIADGATDAEVHSGVAMVVLTRRNNGGNKGPGLHSMTSSSTLCHDNQTMRFRVHVFPL